MVIRMRHTRAHTANRRSHHALTAPALSTCANCAAKHRPHHMCLDCGFYKGKMVMDMSAKKKSREERMQAKKDAIKTQNGSTETSSLESIPEETAEIPLEKIGAEKSKVVDSPEMAQPKTATPRKGQAS